MRQNGESYTILLMEDDPSDTLLLQRALQKNNIFNPLQIVSDGIEGIRYLSGEGRYCDRHKYPFPKLIVLDLKMPRMSGLEVLQHIQDNPELRVIPTLVLTSSRIESDVAQAYASGANTYLVKPGSFSELQALVKTVHDYWKNAHRPNKMTSDPEQSLRRN